jgi:uncharacterized protein
MSPSSFFLSVIFLMALLDVAVLMRMYVILGASRHRSFWRGFLLVWWSIALVFCFGYFFHNIKLGSTADPLPRWLVASQYIWHFLLLPSLALLLIVEIGYRLIRGVWRRLWLPTELKTEPAPENPSLPSVNLSRRHFLASAALVTAPVATVALTELGESQIGKFRLRFFDLEVDGLPKALDNYTITVIADVHVGVFSTQKMLDDIVEASNRLRSELVLMPGDLINVAHADIPSALDMVQRLDSRDGVYLVEGNHDVVQGSEGFDSAVRRRGVKILTDEATAIKARGVWFQLLGTRWLSAEDRDDSVAYTASLREPGMFAMMMAHHPHSWDVAADHGIPLVISGHTHGGQIMLTRSIGLGRLRFRYLSGKYTRPGSTLIVSNGVGNWFPLRIGAPAEILKITLHPVV